MMNSVLKCYCSFVLRRTKTDSVADAHIPRYSNPAHAFALTVRCEVSAYTGNETKHCSHKTEMKSN